MQRTAQAVLFVAINVGGFGALIWGWRRFAARADEGRPLWRRVLAACGLFFASLQATLLAAFWATNLGGWRNGYNPYFASWVRAEFVAFALALSCLLVGSGRYRWWALLSSVLLFVVCFFVALSM